MLWWCGGNSRPRTVQESLVYACLSRYYALLHRFRYYWFAAIVLVAIGCSFVATKLSLPTSSEVRVLRGNHEFEQNYMWRQHLLLSELERDRGARVWLVWGVIPADTGNHNNPQESSTVVLDDEFDPSSPESQLYLRDFCDSLHSQSFASEDTAVSPCPMSYFENWLGEQSSSTTPNELYLQKCENATELPVSPDILHSCMIAFAQAENYKRILFKDGKIRIIRLPFRQQGASWDVGQTSLAEAWSQLNEFISAQNDVLAPRGVDNVYGSSHAFWWYDTNNSILSTATGSIGVVLGAVYFVVLVSNRSFLVTFAAVFSIGFNLLFSTAILVSVGWSFGL